tara:strand:- start:5380 stop:5688 length:309 start_codon:yes stop_codon:yes gene_type:complete
VEQTVIDLNKYKILGEQTLATFGAELKYVLQGMFGLNRASLNVRGTSREIEKFVAALAGEKKYMESYLKYGLDDPRTLSNKYKLQNAAGAFERETGIIWPFK